MEGKLSLYERLGGIYPISLVVNRFSNSLLTNSIVGERSDNPELSKWHTVDYATRLPGLKVMRTLWLAAISGGPFEYTGKSLREAHFHLNIESDEFDAVADELANALDYYKIQDPERGEVLAAFIAQKPDVTAGSELYENDYINSAIRCPFGSTYF